MTQYELWKAIWSSINDRNFFELDWALARHNEMLATFAPATFIGNHDVTRIASRIVDPRHLPHAIVLLAVLGGTPTIYAGDEYALEGIKEDRAGGDDAIRPEFAASGPVADGDADTAGEADTAGDQTIYRLHQRLIGLRRRHAWLYRATTTKLQLRNDQYLIRLEYDSNRIDVALNLADHPLPVPQSARVLDADAGTLQEPTRVAPHGWAVLEPGDVDRIPAALRVIQSGIEPG